MEDDVGSSIGDLLDEGVNKRRYNNVNPNVNSKQQRQSVERQVSVLSSADDVYVPQFSGTFNMKPYNDPQQQQQQQPQQVHNDLLTSITNIPLTKHQQQPQPCQAQKAWVQLCWSYHPHCRVHHLRLRHWNL